MSGFAGHLNFCGYKTLLTEKFYKKNISAWLQRYKENMKYSRESTLEVPFIYTP